VRASLLAPLASLAILVGCVHRIDLRDRALPRPLPADTVIVAAVVRSVDLPWMITPSFASPAELDADLVEGSIPGRSDVGRIRLHYFVLPSGVPDQETPCYRRGMRIAFHFATDGTFLGLFEDPFRELRTLSLPPLEAWRVDVAPVGSAPPAPVKPSPAP
jgi:hypothetical protein